jgi:hypothetical protein
VNGGGRSIGVNFHITKPYLCNKVSNKPSSPSSIEWKAFIMFPNPMDGWDGGYCVGV